MNQAASNDKTSPELSKIFHEIKNPLALISSSLQLIEGEHPEVRDFRFWKQTMKDLSGLCRLLNDLSSLEKSSVLHRTLINLFDFTEDLLDSTEAFFLEHSIPFILENTIEDLDFYADEDKLRRALINLLKNAAESSLPDSPVTLHIFQDEEFLCFSVRDQGCGINPEQQEHLFEPFHTTKSYGTGLGLPIVRRIVEAHHGVLQVSSRCGEGTAFQICIPFSKQSTDC